MAAPWIISRRSLAKAAADRWKNQYFAGGRWYDDRKREIHELLVELGDNPDPNDVDDAIGNKSWTNISCNGCEANGLDRAVVVGEEMSIESRTATLCEQCLAAAAKKLEAGR